MWPSQEILELRRKHRYTDLKIELQKRWKMRVVILPLVLDQSLSVLKIILKR